MLVFCRQKISLERLPVVRQSTKEREVEIENGMLVGTLRTDGNEDQGIETVIGRATCLRDTTVEAEAVAGVPPDENARLISAVTRAEM